MRAVLHADEEEKHQPVAAPGPRLRFLLSKEHLDGGVTDGTVSLHGIATVLHRHLLRVLHFRLLFALDTVGFCHRSYPFSTMDTRFSEQNELVLPSSTVAQGYDECK